MEPLTITCTDITDVRARFHRIQTKALLLARSPRQKQLVLGRAPTIFSIGLSEFSHSDAPESRLQNCERRLEQIESKLDRLLEMQHESRNSPPIWFDQSSEQLLREIGSVGGQIKDLASCRSVLATDNETLRREIEEMAEGADRFLSGLQGRLSQREIELFLELICTETGSFGRRCRSYAEIGKRLHGVTKQAIESRVKKLRQKHPDVWEYVRAIRSPGQTIPYSGLSPSERRKKGIDESYNYDEG